MGDDFVSFSCHHCNHCCTEVACLPTPWDVRRIMKMTGKDPYQFIEFLTPEEVRDVDEDDPTWLEVDGERYIMALQRDEMTGCTFLNNETRFCSIYEARPNLCRLYPFKVEETDRGEYLGFTLQDDVGCPKYTDGKVAAPPLHDLLMQDEVNQEDYRELVEVFNAKQYDGKEVDDFVILFTGGLVEFDQNLAEERG